MNILIADRLIKGRPNADWKEGWEFYYAFNNIGHKADIAGPDCPIDDADIPKIHKEYDFILITENYWPDPTPTAWKFWDWGKISTPKIFWAIDSHLIDFRPYFEKMKVNMVLCNIAEHVNNYGIPGMWMPYGVSKKHFGTSLPNKKQYDIVFIGATQQGSPRQYYLDKYGIKHIEAYGPEYVRQMQLSKICFNLSMANHITTNGLIKNTFNNPNAKMVEIVASGSFMLSNNNQAFREFMNCDIVDNMLFRNEYEFKTKMDYYLSHDEEREDIAKRARNLIFEKHSYEARAKSILEFFESHK